MIQPVITLYIDCKKLLSCVIGLVIGITISLGRHFISSARQLLTYEIRPERRDQTVNRQKVMQGGLIDNFVEWMRRETD